MSYACLVQEANTLLREPLFDETNAGVVDQDVDGLLAAVHFLGEGLDGGGDLQVQRRADLHLRFEL